MKVSVDRPEWERNLNFGYNGFLSRRRDFVANRINWFSRWDQISGIPICHTFIVAGPDSVIEAHARTGVAYGSLSSYVKDPTVSVLIRKPVRYTTPLGKRIVETARRHLHEKYGFGLIVADLLANTFVGHYLNRCLNGVPNRLVCNFLDSDVSMICSELVALADHEPELIGQGFLTRPVNTVKPIDIFEDAFAFEPGAIELV